MGRNKQSVDLLVAKGKSHLTKAEIKKRRSQEIKVVLMNITIPEYLPADLHAKFSQIADKLLSIGVFTELDEDALARYLLNEQLYQELGKNLDKALREYEAACREGTSFPFDNVAKMQSAVSNAYRIVHMAASELGLTIASRAKLVIPSMPDEALPDL